MARKAGLTTEDVVAAAAIVADRDGYAAMTLAQVADVLGVRPPSLYHHVDGIEGLRTGLACHAYRCLGDFTARARASLQGREAFSAQCHAYRAFARHHPGLYAALNQVELVRQDDELWQCMLTSVDPVLASVEEMGFSGDDRWEALRLFRASIHGFLSLEMVGSFAFDMDVDASYGHLIDVLLAGLVATFERT